MEQAGNKAERDLSIGDGPTMRPVPASGGGRRLVAGDTILGRYAVVRELGEGGMGVVYQCLDTVGGVEVAVKGLPPEVSRNEDEMEDIRANYQIVRKLRHPNIAGVATLEKDPAAGDYYLVMDLAVGTTLKRWARRHSDAGLDAKLAILRQVAAALDYAHAEKVLHRDVKPENVMVDDDGRVKVLDFGLAAQIRSSQSRTSKVVTSRSGTWGYMSPEQWKAKPQREQADVYSFGVLAYWIFAGVLPFEGDDPAVLGPAVLAEPVEPVAGLPAHMNAALEKALAKAPEDRFSSCGEFVAALEGRVELQRDRNGRARSPSAPKNGLWKVILAAAALALAVAGGWWYYRQEQVREQARIAAEAERQKTAAEEAKRRAEEEARQKAAAEEAKRKAAEEARQKTAAEEAKRRAEEEARQKAAAEEAKRKAAEEARQKAAAEEAKRKVEEEARQKAAAEEAKRKAEEAAKQRPDDARQEAEEAKARMAEFMQLKTRINIKVSDAKEKMGRISEFRADPDGLESHIASADAQWKAVSAIDTPVTLEAARSALELADKAETQISLDLDWLRKNKAGRDAAKATEDEIKNLLAGDIATFKVERYAPNPCGEGANLRTQGQAAFKKGDFGEAEKLLNGAKAKFAEAAHEAKAFFVKTTLQSAQTYFEAEKWQDCLTEADKVLGWEAGNAVAAKLKKDAESHLIPSLRVVAQIDGAEVSGVKVEVGDESFTTPFVWKLKEGSRYGPYALSYESGGKCYYGTIESVTVDWRGPRVIPIVLKEYTGPKVGDTKTITLPGGAMMEMIYVAPGSFMMGSLSNEDGHDKDEMQHRVTLTKGYWLGKYEVTQEQWQSVMGENPSRFKDGNRPVECVSWKDCQTFIGKINEQLNCGARLPTEAEWEYACRAGSTGPYGGSGHLDDMGWYGGNSGRETHPVGQKQANAWGFYDMHGNVHEWCEDVYSHYGGATIDPTGPFSGLGRILRGGSLCDTARRCRSASRTSRIPGDRNYIRGFRLACSAEPRERAVESKKESRETESESKSATVELRDGAGPNTGDTKTITLPGGATMKMIYVAPGTFTMGSPASEEGRSDDETQHQVTLTKGFWLGKYEVTQEQWQSVMGGNPSRFKDGNRPVECVSWKDCQSFINKINLQQNCGARLPTETEWEYACRAGSTETYGGNGNLDDMGWYSGNSGRGTYPVGQKQANAWGFHDMHGNVYEWCEDWYGDYGTATTDPVGPASGVNRVLRGGNWSHKARSCRSAVRSWSSPGSRRGSNGLRLCCSAEPREVEAGQKKESRETESESKNAAVELMAGAGPKTGKTKTITLPGGATMEMIYCVPGDYVYGDDNTPLHMDHGFWLGKYEVTQRQWESVMGENPSKFKGGDRPVESVSWNDCQKFIEKMNSLLHCGARLPNEHEWEYACRAGTRTKYSWGEVLNGHQANCNGNHPEGTEEKGSYLECTTRVGSYEKQGQNDWGFCDMHGNVWEWCEDKYDASGVGRVLRGGSWSSYARACRSADRDGDIPALRSNGNGFRLCCSVGQREIEAEQKKESHEAESESKSATVELGEDSELKTGDTKTITLPGGATMEMIYLEANPSKGINKGFWLGESEVTQEQWQSVLPGQSQAWLLKRAGYRGPKGFGDNYPVYIVSWNDVQRDYLPKIQGAVKRQFPGFTAGLPTEAQWEYACRAGSTGDYGIDKKTGREGRIDDMAWYGEQSLSPHPVKGKHPNAWGFYDMHGNVFEWCEDRYDSARPDRVSRGGGWRLGAAWCRSACRSWGDPDRRNINQGFRIALAPSP